eukprot:COSAG04_NODE_220_length_19788_cov_11.583575_3_plen_2155_part_00
MGEPKPEPEPPLGAEGRRSLLGSGSSAPRLGSSGRSPVKRPGGSAPPARLSAPRRAHAESRRSDERTSGLLQPTSAPTGEEICLEEMPRHGNSTELKQGLLVGESRSASPERAPRAPSRLEPRLGVSRPASPGSGPKPEPEPEPEPELLLSLQEPEPEPEPVRLGSLTADSPPPLIFAAGDDGGGPLATAAGGDSGGVSPGMHRCPKGHKMRRDLRSARVSRPGVLGSPTAAVGWCAVCGTSGTEFYCPTGCTFDMCSECWELSAADVRERMSGSASPASAVPSGGAAMDEQQPQQQVLRREVYDEVLNIMEKCAEAYTQITRDARGYVTHEAAETALLALCNQADGRFGPPVVSSRRRWLQCFRPKPVFLFYMAAVLVMWFKLMSSMVDASDDDDDDDNVSAVMWAFAGMIGSMCFMMLHVSIAQRIDNGARPGDHQMGWTRWLPGTVQPSDQPRHDLPLYASDAGNFGEQCLLAADPSTDQATAVSESMFLAKCLSLCAPYSCDASCRFNFHCGPESCTIDSVRHRCPVSFACYEDLRHAFESLCVTEPQCHDLDIGPAFSVQAMASSLRALTYFCRDNRSAAPRHSDIVKYVAEVRGKSAPLAAGDFFALIFALACEFDGAIENDTNLSGLVAPWLKRLADLHPLAVMRSLTVHCEAQHSARPSLSGRRGSVPASMDSKLATRRDSNLSDAVALLQPQPQTRAEYTTSQLQQDEGAIRHAMADVHTLIPWLCGQHLRKEWFPTAALASEPLELQMATLKPVAECKRAFGESSILDWDVRHGKLCAALQDKPAKVVLVDDDDTVLLQVRDSGRLRSQSERRVEQRLGGVANPSCGVPSHSMTHTQEPEPVFFCDLCRTKCFEQRWRCVECDRDYCFSCRPETGSRIGAAGVNVAHTQWALLDEYAFVHPNGGSTLRIAKEAFLRGKPNSRLGEPAALEDVLAAMPRSVAGLKAHERARIHQLCRPDADGLISATSFMLLAVELGADVERDDRYRPGSIALRKAMEYTDELMQRSIVCGGLWLSLGLFWVYQFVVIIRLFFLAMYRFIRDVCRWFIWCGRSVKTMFSQGLQETTEVERETDPDPHNQKQQPDSEKQDSEPKPELEPKPSCSKRLAPLKNPLKVLFGSSVLVQLLCWSPWGILAAGVVANVFENPPPSDPIPWPVVLSPLILQLVVVYGALTISRNLADKSTPPILPLRLNPIRTSSVDSDVDPRTGVHPAYSCTAHDLYQQARSSTPSLRWWAKMSTPADLRLLTRLYGVKGILRGFVMLLTLAVLVEGVSVGMVLVVVEADIPPYLSPYFDLEKATLWQQITSVQIMSMLAGFVIVVNSLVVQGLGSAVRFALHTRGPMNFLNRVANQELCEQPENVSAWLHVRDIFMQSSRKQQARVNGAATIGVIWAGLSGGYYYYLRATGNAEHPDVVFRLCQGFAAISAVVSISQLVSIELANMTMQAQCGTLEKLLEYNQREQSVSTKRGEEARAKKLRAASEAMRAEIDVYARAPQQRLFFIHGWPVRYFIGLVTPLVVAQLPAVVTWLIQHANSGAVPNIAPCDQILTLNSNCSFSVMENQTTLVQRACCPADKDISTCDLPDYCVGACADAFMPWHSGNCYEELFASTPTARQPFDSFAFRCAVDNKCLFDAIREETDVGNCTQFLETDVLQPMDAVEIGDYNNLGVACTRATHKPCAWHGYFQVTGGSFTARKISIQPGKDCSPSGRCNCGVKDATCGFELEFCADCCQGTPCYSGLDDGHGFPAAVWIRGGSATLLSVTINAPESTSMEGIRLERGQLFITESFISGQPAVHIAGSVAATAVFIDDTRFGGTMSDAPAFLWDDSHDYVTVPVSVACDPNSQLQIFSSGLNGTIYSPALDMELAYVGGALLFGRTGDQGTLFNITNDHELIGTHPLVEPGACPPSFTLSGAASNKFDGTYARLPRPRCNDKPVFQKGGADGYMLYQPTGYTSWWASTASHGKSCEAGAPSISSPGSSTCSRSDTTCSCDASPDGAGCAGKWEQTPGGCGESWCTVPSVAVVAAPCSEQFCVRDVSTSLRADVSSSCTQRLSKDPDSTFNYNNRTRQLVLGNGRCVSSLTVPARQQIPTRNQHHDTAVSLSLSSDQATVNQPFGHATEPCKSGGLSAAPYAIIVIGAFTNFMVV